MFGYVKAYKPELRIKEFEMYKAIYCSLCKDLGKKYGIVSRFSLSYDFTFLSLLYLSLRDGCVKTERKNCVCNPLKKCNFLKSSDIPDMPTAAAEIMLYSKLKDNISDEGFLKSCFYRILKALSKKGYLKAAKDFPHLAELFDEYLKNQNEVEKIGIQNIDAAADPTAKMLSKLFSLCAVGDEKRALERLGYCMGRWISQLNMCIKESTAAFELLDIMRFKNILGNIIYLGLEDSQKQLFLKEQQK